MKPSLLLIVLTLGMFSINGSAQTKKQNVKGRTTYSTQQGGQVMKFRQVAEDGYVWYKLKQGNLYGARDADGNDIIPIRYDEVEYNCSNISGWHYFRVKCGEYNGAYTREGTCVIATERQYSLVFLSPSGDGKICWIVNRKSNTRKHIVLDAKGKELFSIECDNLDFRCTSRFGKKSDNEPVVAYFVIREGDLLSKDKYEGICDLNGNILLQPESKYHSAELRNGGHDIYWWDKEGNHYELPCNYNTITNNNYIPYESLYYKSEINSSSSSSQNTISTSASTNSSSSGGTSTIVVEHHRDPVPVQEWHACLACGGMGTMGCDNCGGSGTKYIGDRLHRCSRCNGRGIIPCNVCYGNKGQYTTVYR